MGIMDTNKADQVINKMLGQEETDALWKRDQRVETFNGAVLDGMKEAAFKATGERPNLYNTPEIEMHNNMPKGWGNSPSELAASLKNEGIPTIAEIRTKVGAPQP